MRFSGVLALCLLGSAATTNAFPGLAKRDAQFAAGQPIDANGKGGPILGMRNRYSLSSLPASNSF
jgi:hypothetical protein